MFLLQLKSRLIAGQKWGFKSAQPGQLKSSLGASTCCLFGCRQACVLVLLPHGMQHLLAAWPKVQKAEGRRRGFRKQRARRPPAAASTTLSPGLDWQHKTILS